MILIQDLFAELFLAYASPMKASLRMMVMMMVICGDSMSMHIVTVLEDGCENEGKASLWVPSWC